VVGGGSVAARRAEWLLDGGAAVTVVAPVLCDALQQLAESGRIDHIAAAYDYSHLDNVRFVVAATDNAEVNVAVARDAAERSILLNDADEPSRGDVIVPSVIRRGDLILAVTTLGGSPSVAKRIRDELAAAYGPEWEPYVALLREARDNVLAAVGDAARRRAILNTLAGDDSLLDLIREGRVDEARARALSCISPSSD